jgi:hypothetical protein
MQLTEVRGMQTPTREQIDAAARVIWDDYCGRFTGSSFDDAKDDEVIKIQVRATARAALTAAHVQGRV